MTRILIAIDDTPAARAAVTYGLDLAAAQEAEVTFLHVLPASDWERQLGFGPDGPSPQSTTPEDRTSLEAASALAADAGVTADAVLLSGDPVERICTYAADIDADLLVVGSRGRRALTAALLGSVSRGVVRSAGRPVVVVPEVCVRRTEEQREPVAAG
jgi:nucleotide-binding universal stress UspA family protein